MVYATAELSVTSVYKTLIHTIYCLLNNSMEQSPSWETDRFSASQEITRNFMEHEGSLPYTQMTANSPYRKPAQSSPYPHFPLPEDSS